MLQGAQDPFAEASPSVSRQFTLMTTLAAYCVVLVVGITHHEPWADEAQAWLLSRDLGYRYLVFRQLAYEGHPPLWPTILWIASHWLHLPYQSMNWIGGLCAIAGCWFFCRYSPFPIFVRVLFPFTYFMAFQYAIVARPYVLLPLCTFAVAHFFADADRRPWRFVAAASALTLVTAPGAMIAVGLVGARVWYTFRSWHDILPRSRKKVLGALIVFGIVLAFVAFVNWPPVDRANARFDRPADENHGFAVLPSAISTAFFGSFVPSIVFQLVVGGWCACRRRLLPFALPTAFLLVVFAVVYVNLWHCGALTLIVFAAFWIAWPCKERTDPKVTGAVRALLSVGLVGLFAVHIYWTARTLAMDYSGAYSGSLDAANFLRSVGADTTSTCATSYVSVAIQPYFRESIYENWPQGESFWRFEMGNRAGQSCSKATWVVVSRCCSYDSASTDKIDRLLRSIGYVPAHISKGSMFFEGREVGREDFFIYRLVGAGISN